MILSYPLSHKRNIIWFKQLRREAEGTRTLYSVEVILTAECVHVSCVCMSDVKRCKHANKNINWQCYFVLWLMAMNITIGWFLSGVVLSGGVYVRVSLCPGGFCPGGFCPGGIMSVYQVIHTLTYHFLVPNKILYRIVS